MREYIKENALRALIPFLRIENTLPLTVGPEDELVFVSDSGIYKSDGSTWQQVVNIGGGGTNVYAVGLIKPFPKDTTDHTAYGWLLCDGSTYNYNDYPELALLIDPTLTPGSTFQVPDLRTFYPTMIGQADVSLGLNDDVYTLSEIKHSTLPEHQHPAVTDTHSHSNLTLSHYHSGAKQSSTVQYLNTNNTTTTGARKVNGNTYSENATWTFSAPTSVSVTVASDGSGSVNKIDSYGCNFYIRAVQ